MSEDRLVKVVLAIRDGLTEIVERLNDVLKEYAPETTIPKLNLTDIEELPWTSYKTKERAKLGEPAWIFSNLDEETAKELVKAIKASDGQRLELGEYEFKLSGEKSQFISRRSVKK